VATWDRVLFQIWRWEVPPASVAELDRIARAFMADRSRPISSLAVIEATATPPSPAARQALSKFYQELASAMTLAVVVPEGSGFRAAFVRGVGLTLSALSPRMLPFKFVGSVDQAALLLAPHLSFAAGGAKALVERVDELRIVLSNHAARLPGLSVNR
jgi:hypothetical protein